MRFRIRHATSYRYDRPVALSPHVFRMKPRAGEFLRLDDFRVAIYPPPAEISAYADAEGNSVVAASFEGETQALRVLVESAGEKFARPWPAPDAAFFPASYGQAELAALPQTDFFPAGPAVEELAVAVRAETGESIPGYLAALSARMHASLRDESRLHGPPHDPETTLHAGSGSCRDFAVVFMACCRHYGIAARFVSGYLPAAPGERQHMHAWAEALIPGTGWIPYDPTRGGLVSDEHIPVAAAVDSPAATPVEGAFTSLGPVRSEMNVELTVETEANAE